MSKLLIILFIAFLGHGHGVTVYLCNGPKSAVYHKIRNCQGLKKCSSEIAAVDMAVAKAKKRRACGNCCKK